MAKNKQQEERVKALVAELLAAEQEDEEATGRVENIDDIEAAMVRIGDAVAREVGLQKLSQHTASSPEQAPCPRCGRAGELVGRRAREVLTRRGAVPVTEAKYRCPKCRRHFFPSDQCVGS